MQYVPDADNMFKCLSSNDKKIPFDWVNDDYCDCPEDGSDEPATGACQNGKFYCTIKDSRQELLKKLIKAWINLTIDNECSKMTFSKGHGPK